MYVQSSKTVTYQPLMTVKCVKFLVGLNCVYGIDEKGKRHLLDMYDDNNTAERAYELIYDHLATGDHAVKMSDIRKELRLST